MTYLFSLSPIMLTINKTNFSENEALKFGQNVETIKNLSESSDNISRKLLKSTGNYRTAGIRSEKKPVKTFIRTPHKPDEDEDLIVNDDELESSGESFDERVERVIYNPKQRRYNNNRYDRPSRSKNTNTVLSTKQNQANTPGGVNPYDLLGKYNNSRDEYADSYYNSNTPRNLSPTMY